MLIKSLDHKTIVEVFAIYWVDGIRHHLVIPYPTYEGLFVITEKKSEIVDPSIDGFILRKSGSGRDILIHWATDKDDLLDKLIDHDEDAMKELERRLREETPPYLKSKT